MTARLTPVMKTALIAALNVDTHEVFARDVTRRSLVERGLVEHAALIKWTDNATGYQEKTHGYVLTQAGVDEARRLGAVQGAVEAQRLTAVQPGVEASGGVTVAAIVQGQREAVQGAPVAVVEVAPELEVPRDSLGAAVAVGDRVRDGRRGGVVSAVHVEYTDMRSLVTSWACVMVAWDMGAEETVHPSYLVRVAGTGDALSDVWALLDKWGAEVGRVVGRSLGEAQGAKVLSGVRSVMMRRLYAVEAPAAPREAAEAPVRRVRSVVAVEGPESLRRGDVILPLAGNGARTWVVAGASWAAHQIGVVQVDIVDSKFPHRVEIGTELLIERDAPVEAPAAPVTLPEAVLESLVNSAPAGAVQGLLGDVAGAGVEVLAMDPVSGGVSLPHGVAVYRAQRSVDGGCAWGRAEVGDADGMVSPVDAARLVARMVRAGGLAVVERRGAVVVTSSPSSALRLVPAGRVDEG